MKTADYQELPIEEFGQSSVPIDEEVRVISGELMYLSLEVVTTDTVAPAEILIGYLRDGRLQVVEPILVKFCHEGASFIAEATDLNEFGFGSNQSEAIADLQHAIAELYFSLRDDQHRLGPDLQEVWETVNQAIKPASP